MRVVEYDRYGDESVLVVRERPAPEVRPGRVLVRVHAAALNPKDVLTRAGKYPWMAGRQFPKRVGYDWAGEAVAVGTGVRGVVPGDRVFGMIDAWSAGACAELLLAHPDQLALTPAGLDDQSAAAIPLTGSTALQALRDLGEVSPGQRVLINGASGGLGVMAIQIAKALGAHVTTLTSERNQELARSLGADAALDYARWTPAEDTASYDTIFDVYGNRSFAEVRRLLAPRGTFVSTVPKRHVIAARISTVFSRPRARLVVVRSRRADLAWLAEAAARGRLRAVIDRVLPLTEIADAQRYLATRRARGKVVLTLRDALPALRVAGTSPGA